MSRLRADSLVNYSGSGTPNFKSGVTGAAVTFTGDITAANGSFTGNVTIDGNLTYKDVTNVDSVGIITAQQGIQVSANGVTVSGVGTFNNPITVAGIATINGGGLDVTGVITATSYSGDGSSLSGVSPSVSGIASGTLANGQTVILQSDGTVTGIATTSQSLGSATVFESGNVTDRGIDAAFDTSNGKVVIVYKDGGDSDKGKAVVGTVSGTSISFGTPVVFETTAMDYTSITFDSNANKFLIAYQEGGGNQYGKARVGTVSGTSISFGTEVQFVSEASDIVGTFDSSNNKIVLAYRDNNNYGAAIVGTISGTDVSFGSVAQFQGSDSRNPDITFDSTNNKVVIAWRHLSNSHYGTAIVGTVSGTSISFGSAVVFESARSENISATYDSSNEKVVIVFTDNGDSDKGKAIVGTVSGTSISFGSPVVFDSAAIFRTAAVYDSNAGKVVIAYKDGGNSGGGYNYGRVIVGTVSGTSISFDTSLIFESAATDNIDATFASNINKVIIGYRDEGNSNYGTSIVFRNESTNLTSSNFLGFSNAAYTDGQTATVQIAGAVDDAQSGLTTASVHYVQNDGTLSTTAGTPSVEAGLALSATEIAIKA